MDDLLIRAAELIENDWTKEELGEPGKGMCIDGAIRAAILETGRDFHIGISNLDGMILGRTSEYATALDRTASVLPEPEGCCKLSEVAASRDRRIWHYNDNHCTGGVEAAKILREAAEVEL